MSRVRSWARRVVLRWALRVLRRHGWRAVEPGLGACLTRAERADLLAYLARKRTNAETVARNGAGFAEQGRWTARMLAVLEQDIAAGLHEGEAALGAAREAV